VNRADSSRILPAYYNDNYISLLPGETREIEYPATVSKGLAQLTLRGWNLVPRAVAIAESEIAPAAGKHERGIESLAQLLGSDALLLGLATHRKGKFTSIDRTVLTLLPERSSEHERVVSI